MENVLTVFFVPTLTVPNFHLLTNCCSFRVYYKEFFCPDPIRLYVFLTGWRKIQKHIWQLSVHIRYCLSCSMYRTSYVAVPNYKTMPVCLSGSFCIQNNILLIPNKQLNVQIEVECEEPTQLQLIVKTN